MESLESRSLSDLDGPPCSLSVLSDFVSENYIRPRMPMPAKPNAPRKTTTAA